jgi:hypothetical protein
MSSYALDEAGEPVDQRPLRPHRMQPSCTEREKNPEASPWTKRHLGLTVNVNQ